MKHARLISTVFSVFALALLTYCTTTKQSSDSKGNANWAGGMQELARSLDKLSPYIYSRIEFSDPKNQREIEKAIADYSAGINLVPEHTGEALLGKDPILKFSLRNLKSNSKEALRAFREGELEFSRNILRSSTAACFNCHSTQNLGPQFTFANRQIESQFRLSSTERADYFVATRQFDKALEVLDGVVQSPAALLENPREQLAALRKYLFIQVRVKNDPGPAILLLDRYLSWNHLPYFLMVDAEAWMQSLRQWQQTKASTQKDFLESSKNILKTADKKQLSSYDAGFVDYLRASQVLHEGLRSAKDVNTQAQAYGLLGTSYENLTDASTWNLPEVYYEACVRTVPNSIQAKKCYKSYERSIILGFSGSGGTYIPSEERELLVELKSLAGLKESAKD
jgi:hypothetical protein